MRSSLTLASLRNALALESGNVSPDFVNIVSAVTKFSHFEYLPSSNLLCNYIASIQYYPFDNGLGVYDCKPRDILPRRGHLG